MSDGPSDCARAAESKAEKFVKEKYSAYRRINIAGDAPKRGTVVFVYEEWLDHIVEVITDRLVVARYLVRAFNHKTRLLTTGEDDWPVGYYQDNLLPRKTIDD